MRIYYCDNCDRLIKVNEQTRGMFVDDNQTAYCRECRESFCDSSAELEEADPYDSSQFHAPIKRRPKSGFWRAYRRPKVQSNPRKATRRTRSNTNAPKRKSW